MLHESLSERRYLIDLIQYILVSDPDSKPCIHRLMYVY